MRTWSVSENFVGAGVLDILKFRGVKAQGGNYGRAVPATKVVL